MMPDPRPGLRAVPPLAERAPRPNLSNSAKGELRGVLGRFATGITVVTSSGEYAHGMTANSFNSVSLDPPLVLVCVGRQALMHDAIVTNEVFAVSMLGADQEDVARHFANRGRPAGLAQFDAVDWAPGPRTGAPLLGGALAWLECELSEMYEGGDHSIFLGRVVGLGRSTGSGALLFFGGAYHRILSNHAA